MDYKIVKYSSSHLSSLTSLLHQCFDIENKDKKGLVIWKYFDEHLKNQTITYIALDGRNTVVSHYANLPVDITYLDKKYKCMICTDMCTDVMHRGRGLISKLSNNVYEQVEKNGYDFSIGYSNDEGVKVDTFATNYNYEIIGKFVRYFKFIVRKKKTGYRLEMIHSLDRDYYSHYSKYIRIKKDHDYLFWRYFKKPNSEYEMYKIIDGEKNVGYVVLRPIRYKCYIYDIVTENDDMKHMVSVLRSIENKMYERKTRFIVYNVLDNSYWKKLFNKYKYFKRTNNTINYYLTIRIHNSKIPKEIILNKENWLLMNGDIL